MFHEIQLPQLPYRPPIDLEAEHPFTVYDLVRCRRLSDPVVSPDGSRVVVVLEHWSEEDDKVTRTLWLVPLDGGDPVPLTAGHGVRDESPTWSPDGRYVAFVSDRSGSHQIWLVDAEALDGRVCRLTDFAADVRAIRWSPAGDHIALSARVFPGMSLEETAEEMRRRDRSPARVRFYDRLPARHWDRWLDGRYAHLFVLPIRQQGDGGWEVAGEPLDLMPDVEADCPLSPFGGRSDYDWSPDGTELAYCVHVGRDRAWTTNVHVFTVSVDGSNRRCLTEDNPAIDGHPRYSPDGQYLAILSTTRPGFESDRRRVRLFDRRTGQVRTLTETWDRSPSGLCWSHDARALYMVADSEARRCLYRWPLDGTDRREPETLVSDGYCDSVQVTADGTVVFLHDTMVRPAELALLRPGQLQLQRCTRFNDHLLQNVRFGRHEDFWFRGADGDRVHAWVVEPPGRAADQKVPVVVIIHGGPQGVVSDHFHYRWHPQIYAGAGYAVLAINFHGSAGFGQKFVDSVSRDWGGKPYEDIMAGLEAALERYPWMDGQQ